MYSFHLSSATALGLILLALVFIRLRFPSSFQNACLINSVDYILRQPPFGYCIELSILLFPRMLCFVRTPSSLEHLDAWLIPALSAIRVCHNQSLWTPEITRRLFFGCGCSIIQGHGRSAYFIIMFMHEEGEEGRSNLKKRYKRSARNLSFIEVFCITTQRETRF